MSFDKLPGGLWPVMLTAFNENNQVDVNGVARLTEFYIESGSNGLFSNCQSSEMFQLTNDERLLVIRTVMKAAGNRVPVVATGTFSASMQTSADFIKRVYDTGVAAVIVLSNQLADTGEDEGVLMKKTEELLGLTGNIPLGLYECPYPYKRLLSPKMMKWMGETGRFFYHKDTSCDPEAIKLKVKAVENTPFAFYNADTPTALMSLQNGAVGISPIGANLYPELYSSLIDMYNGQQKQNEEKLNWLSARLTVMGTVADLCYPYSAKVFLQERGFEISSICRVSHEKMKPDGYLKIKALAEMYRETKKLLNI